MSAKKVILTIIILIFVVYITLNHLVFISSSTTCAKFNTQGQTKGANYLLYEFEINGVKYDGNESSSRVIDISSDSLKK